MRDNKSNSKLENKYISEYIFKQIQNNKKSLKNQFDNTKSEIGYFFIDDLLPKDIAEKCFDLFPNKADMKVLKSLKEYKYVSAQMDKHDKFLEEVIYAFQDKRIVDLIAEVCGIESLYPDDSLYAGGLSLMSKNNFLNPHLDNSHDADRKRWRVLNLLYYVTPNWKKEYGGHLELWPNGPDNNPILVESKFNRLIVMATHDLSWHSVNKVNINEDRCCISNYYFSNEALKSSDSFHVTTFKGRPNETFKNIILNLDSNLRMFVRKIFKKGIRKNPHFYKKKK